MLNTIFKNNEGTVNHAQTASIGHFPPVGIGIAPGQTPQGVLPGNVINLIKNCVYNQQNILKNFLFLKKFCFFL